MFENMEIEEIITRMIEKYGRLNYEYKIEQEQYNKNNTLFKIAQTKRDLIGVILHDLIEAKKRSEE